LYSKGNEISIPNDVIESGVYCVENSGVPLFSFVNDGSQYSILFRNSSNKGSQFILSSVETSSLKWVIFVHLFTSKKIASGSGLNISDKDWQVVNIFLTTLSSIVSTYFGMVEIWITPFYYDGSDGYVFDDDFYSYVHNKLQKPYNLTMFFGITLEDLLNVWS
jgi:hypothetical protein